MAASLLFSTVGFGVPNRSTFCEQGRLPPHGSRSLSYLEKGNGTRRQFIRARRSRYARAASGSRANGEYNATSLQKCVGFGDSKKAWPGLVHLMTLTHS